MPNLEELKQFAEQMAEKHQIAVSNRKFRPRFPKLEENIQVLVQAYQSTNEEVKSKGNIVPAAEWLLDNFYIIEEQYKEIQYSIKKDLYRNLPVLSKGTFSGYSRVYGIAAGMTEHLDGNMEEDVIVTF